MFQFDIGDRTDFDDDGDGAPDVVEILRGPNPLDPDTDGDGISDFLDSFPRDPDNWKDSDGDGIGDESDLLPNFPLRFSLVVMLTIILSMVVLIYSVVTVIRKNRFLSNINSRATDKIPTVSGGYHLPSPADFSDEELRRSGWTPGQIDWLRGR